MQKKAFGLFLLQITTSVSILMAEPTEKTVKAVINGVRLTNETIQGKGQPIRSSGSGFYGGGFIIGRSIKATPDGIWFKTWELQISQGGFSDTNNYLSSVVHVSTDQQDVFEKAQGLDDEKIYVFEYKDINPLDPEIEDSHLQITAIYTIEEFLQKRNTPTLPAEIRSGDVFEGLKVNGGLKRGRIVDVERYGFFGNFCSFELNVGGLQATGTGEALLAVTVLDEAVCKYVEDIIALGQDVEMTYDEDFWEVWQPSSFFCKGLRVIPRGKNEQQAVSQTSGESGTPLTEKQLEILKKKIVEDPAFVDSLIEALKRQANTQ